ncbi:MAG: CatA-like O-acetyltransferase [Bacteroidota bacterium]
MKIITFTDPHRKKHFEFFRAMDQPHFGITAEVDITLFLQKVRASADLRFTPGLVYLIGRTALRIPPFCRRIRKEQVVEHTVLRPSFTVPTAKSEVFSFCTVTYQEDPRAFHQHTVERIAAMETEPSFEDEEGADNYLFLSAFPWASFTSITHAMHYHPGDSIPRITWGKYFKRENRVLMPLGVQAHHAIVDGSDLGKYYQEIQRLLNNSDEIFKNFR